MKKQLQFILENTAAGKIDKGVAAVLLAEAKKQKRTERMDIAVIGMSAVMPRSPDLAAFWSMIAAKTDCIAQFPDSRRRDAEAYISYMGRGHNNLNFAKAGYLDEVDKFDYAFFGMPPKEAQLMDPNQRLFLQTAWGALEDAGYGGDGLRGSRTGVYAGFDNSTVNAYRQLIADVLPEQLALATTGNILPLIASRISHLLDFRGPSMLVDTTCSSSLLAVHVAVRALQNRECDLAIAGSVKLSLFPVLPEDKLGVEAGDGRTKAFDNRSDGTGIGEGVGAVLLKPLDKALRDGDAVYAVIRGGAANHDGASVGLTAPNMLAQEDVITRALKDAEAEAESIGCIEAHGTGTKLGDPIEIQGIARAFGKQTERRQFCAIGSLKSNIGHLDHGSGIASFIKAVLALYHKQLPPTLHFEQPNRAIPYADSPVYVNDLLKDWPAGPLPRRCGVSSFGLSGTNCHLILEEAPTADAVRSSGQEEESRRPCLLVLSAKSETALANLASSVIARLRGIPAASFADICYTLAVGRGHYTRRLCIVADSPGEAARLLEQALAQGEHRAFPQASDAATGGLAPDEAAGQLVHRLGGVGGRDEARLLLGRLGALYRQGARVEWERLFDPKQHRRVHLPSYPFDKIRCWVSVPEALPGRPVHSPEEALPQREEKGVHVVIADAEYAPGIPGAGYGEALQAVADAWGEALGLERLGVTDHLFELGGDSIFAAKITSLLNRRLGLELELGDLMRNPVLGDFAAVVAEKALTVRQEVRAAAGEGLPAGEDSAAAEGIVPAPEAEHYPLTSPQRRLYVLDKLEGGGNSTAYNMPSAFLIEGPLDRAQLEGAFREVIARHGVLRTGFTLSGGEPVQVIDKDASFRLETVEISSEEAAAAEMARFIAPFDLSRPPLLRAALGRLAEERHVLLFDIHHIVCDGASTELVTRDLLRAYHQPGLAAPPLQFKDYAVWSQRFRTSESWREQARFWSRELEGPLPVLSLPLDFKRPAMQRFEGGRVSFHIPQALLEDLKRLGRENGATLYMVLLALFNVLLAKYSGGTDIIIGSPVSGRTRPELEELPGMFVNTLPMRNFPQPDRRFDEFLREVGHQALLAFRHQDYPFEDMVEAAAPSRDLSRNPVFDVMFMMQNVGLKDIHAEGLVFTPVPFESRVSKVDLTLNVMERKDRLSVDLEYAASLFRRETVERMARFFVSLAKEAAAHPGRPLRELRNISPAEEALLHSFHGPKVEYRREKGVHELIAEQARLAPEAIALVCRERSLTYGELDRLADRLASSLLARGAGADRPVALLVPRSPEMVIGMLGALKAGAAYVPLDPAYPAERIHYMLEDSSAAIALHGGGAEAALLPEGLQTLDLNDPGAYAPEASELLVPETFSSRQLAYIIYTSGSTGRPKGVMVEHRQVHNFIVGITRVLDFHPGKTLLSVTTVSFDIFVLESLLALSRGVKVILANEEEQNHPRLLCECLQKHQADMLQITPSRLQLLLDSRSGASGLATLKEIMIGGEALPGALLRRLRGLGGGALRIFNMYGPTETTVWSTMKEVTHAEDGDITIGTPIANTQAYIVDEHDQPQPIGVPGELLLGGDGVVRGYLGRPELTAEKFIAAPHLGDGLIYRTGDQAKWLANGEIQFLGRNDRLVKLRGYRVELGEIENALLLHPAVAEGAVIVGGDSTGDQRLWAYYSARSRVTPLELKAHLEETLPLYMVPSRYMELPKLPQTPNGKTDRGALPHMGAASLGGQETAAAETASAAQTAVLPQNQLQAQLSKIWGAALGVETIGIHDNFFLLGGNSMKAIMMIAEAEEYGIPLVINDVFKHQTIAELESYITLSGKAERLITDPDQAAEQLSGELGRRLEIVQLAADERTYCVYALADCDPEAAGRALELARISVAGRLYPHYIVDAAALVQAVNEAGGNEAGGQELSRQDPGSTPAGSWPGPIRLDNQAWERLLGLSPLSEADRKQAIRQIGSDHEAFEESILAGEIVKEYRLAPIEHFFLGPERFSGTLLRFDKLLDLDLFNKALALLLEQQGVFRNTLARKPGGLYWREFQEPEAVSVPYADISAFTRESREQFMRDIAADYFFKPYEEWEHLYYRLALVRENLRDYYLFLPVNHSIFDAMSGEVVKRSLLELYYALENGRELPQPDGKSYSGYVEQVRKGPVHISDRGIMEAFQLDRYEAVTQAMNAGLKRYSRDKATYLKFEIRTKSGQTVFDSDNAWQIAFNLLTRFMKAYLDHDELPVSVFYYGRNYEETKYFNTVGEFIDLIPMLVNTKDQTAAETADFIQSRIHLAERHNVNFSNFAVDAKAQRRFPEVCGFVRSMQAQGSVIFNFQGKLEDQEMDAFERLLYKRLMHELNLEEAVNIYFATRYSDDVIQLDISLPFDEDQDRLLSFFREECSIMSDIEVEKYE